MIFIKSLPTPHKNDTNLYSFIKPSNPYILLSQTGTIYLFLDNLEDCKEYQRTQYLCKEVSISKRNKQSQCEVQLFSSMTSIVPKTCKIRNILAELEIWHPLHQNRWLYIFSKPSTINIICQNEETKEAILQ